MEAKCPKCGSLQSVWRGYRRNRCVDKHMKLCKKCGSKFTPNDGFLRMRFKPSVIRRAMELRKKGYSSAEIKEHLQRYEGVKVSRWTVIKWERKYMKGRKS